MPDPLSHHPAMLIVKPNSKPRFWWLYPWSYAKQLHRNCNALKALCDRQDDVIRELRSHQPRWKAERWEDSKGVRYYFHDTHSPELGKDYPHAVYLGKSYLYDAEAKFFAYETDEAKAITRVNQLNAK